jgi:Family of unknown function (DUF5343)
LSSRQTTDLRDPRSRARNGSTLAPPYLSYKTFYGFLERLRKGLPTRIDRSVMSSLSGSSQSQLVAALRYLELVTPTNSPTKSLVILVNSEAAEYPKALREVLNSSYSFLFDGRDLKSMTAQEIKKGFAAAGASGDTVRKCTAFFLAAARHAQIPLPPFITPARIKSKRRTAGTRRGSPSAPSARAGTGENADRGISMALLSKFPDFDAAWPAEIKSKWFDAFERLMARANRRKEFA